MTTLLTILAILALVAIEVAQRRWGSRRPARPGAGTREEGRP
jgi:hypothetical protein